ncbi:unnamed protein product [Ranitomeya imitator]|uniref:Uncharacterized protein n=1 Tax=Ranitomeya imitator TaxID=111125 RepID=A0ABN9KSN8_9NEOB|nr:unnamed protein product [Ranitomeya imitator]
MFTLVTGIVGRWRAVCVTALQRPNSDAAAIRIIVDNIRGVEICTMSMSSQQNQCMHIRFTKSKVKKYEHKVHVQANCFEVGVSEHVFVTMKTVPDYCGIEISKEYHVQGKLKQFFFSQMYTYMG